MFFFSDQNSAAPDSDADALSSGEIVGVVIGVLVLAAAIVLVVRYKKTIAMMKRIQRMCVDKQRVDVENERGWIKLRDKHSLITN